MPLMNSNLITIDRRSALPYDVQIKENIKTLILNQSFYYNTVLPSTIELSNQLDIAEPIVKKAYKALMNEKYISLEKERYTISHIELTHHFFERNTSIYDAIISLGLEPSIECVEKKVVQLEDEDAIKMGFEPHDSKDYLYINRIYYGSKRPIIILENYLPLHIFPGLDKKFQGHEPLNNYIGQEYGFKAHLSNRTTKVVNLNKQIANLLNERVNAASLQSTNQVYDKQGRMIDYGQSHSVSSYYFQVLVDYN